MSPSLYLSRSRGFTSSFDLTLQVGAGHKADTLVGWYLHGGAIPSDRTDFTLLHLAHFKGAKPGEYHFVPSG